MSQNFVNLIMEENKNLNEQILEKSQLCHQKDHELQNLQTSCLELEKYTKDKDIDYKNFTYLKNQVERLKRESEENLKGRQNLQREYDMAILMF